MYFDFCQESSLNSASKYISNLFNLILMYKSKLHRHLIHLQMIESSAHGDEYDGVIFSQLVCKNYLRLNWNFHIYINWKFGSLFSFFIFCLCSELDWFGWIWKFKNWNNWIEKKRRVLHQQKSSNTWNSRCHTMSIFLLRRSFVMSQWIFQITVFFVCAGIDEISCTFIFVFLLVVAWVNVLILWFQWRL
jgi:hypothetical protein